jgi:hypothetical protein
MPLCAGFSAAYFTLNAASPEAVTFREQHTLAMSETP